MLAIARKVAAIVQNVGNQKVCRKKLHIKTIHRKVKRGRMCLPSYHPFVVSHWSMFLPHVDNIGEEELEDSKVYFKKKCMKCMFSCSFPLNKTTKIDYPKRTLKDGKKKLARESEDLRNNKVSPGVFFWSSIYVYQTEY